MNYSENNTDLNELFNSENDSWEQTLELLVKNLREALEEINQLKLKKERENGSR